MTDLGRQSAIAYRARAHGLDAPGDAATVLATGVQDYPPGRSAGAALRLRGTTPARTVLLHTMRGALHVHAESDAALLAAALRIEDGREPAAASMGSFGTGLAAAGTGFATALDAVAAAMRAVTADAVPRTKGELSGAVTPRVDAAFAPFCPGCGVHHVQDALFRYATLQAGLGVEVTAPAQTHYVALGAPGAAVGPAVGRDTARAHLVRRFLRAAGPARPPHLAAWLALTPAAARTWWDLVADELEPVAVEGGRSFAHAADIGALTGAAPVRGVRLLPPCDPLTELADRELAVPDAAHRRQVWRAAGAPGVLLVDGEVAGTWRQRATRSRLALTLTPFAPLAPSVAAGAEPDARTLAACAGAARAEVRVADPA
ncbi:winged helix DNA-binding protein [Murinocardiopsis flavida]|uniref:Winged helix DNA-binding protein n=1 Tax=Murinocardiopsis flavida TaxID=645275 RepID=A0A2P8D997_9ACTN|nr:crosslink repair DNA glycosylase YcaQ family protein [Murinocardiopsis flavida]PSK93751.1 winged helix DNA-binding protein [Murinocardiopsis flavida]